MNTRSLIRCGSLLLLLSLTLGAAGTKAWGEDRKTITLDGEWDVAQGTGDAPPAQYAAKAPVPGLVDMARPPFTEVGLKSAQRDAFWYRTKFRVDGPLPAVATLCIPRAFFGARVYLNGAPVGEHLPFVTPGLFDVAKGLAGDGRENELVVRVGALPDAAPPTQPRLRDGEKSRYIPGIFDTVQLVLSGTPNVVRVQAAPHIADGRVHVQALLHNSAAAGAASTPVTFTVKEKLSGQVVGSATLPAVDVPASGDKTVDADVAISPCHLWTPEDPFLYTLEVKTSADQLVTRFGMREFRLDPATGRAMLNGKPYFLRGSNITLYRFFEDSERGGLPWDRDWVRRLHRSFKAFHWNTLRYSIGTPPGLWYDIADEEGILLQDEYPIWGLDKAVTTDELAQEYAEHMRENWNHPSIVIWDAQNETIHNAEPTGAALQQVRSLDLSNRPWDNGWGQVQAETDSFESHPYHFIKNSKTMAALETALKTPPLGYKDAIFSQYHSPVIINEYAGIWLQRDGQPTKVSKLFYDHILGPDATADQRRETYAHYMAAETEFWRGGRGCAAVLEFTALGYSIPVFGTTSDHFLDVKNLAYEPRMAAAFQNAFAPVGLMIDYWETEATAGFASSIPVVVINDLEAAWNGTVHLTLRRDGKTVVQQDQPASVEPFGSGKVTFQFPAPAEPGVYDLQATITGADGQTVTSDRAFPVAAEADQIAKAGFPAQAATSSSERSQGLFRLAAINAARDNGVGWSSEFGSDPQWIALDLGVPRQIGRVVLSWENAYATSYRLETSPDGHNWTPIYSTDNGQGKTETIAVAPVTARWVRLYATKRATKFGYFLWSFHVYPPDAASPQASPTPPATPASPAAPAPLAPIRVACVGDSITQGPATPKGITYPDQLQQLLGNGWDVENFGLGGCTLLRNGNKPYWNHPQFQKAHDFQPNVVIIMLGTNDSKAANWVNESQFVPDYRDLVKTFQALDTKPKIYLCRVPTVVEPNKYQISETVSAVIRQRVDALGQELGLEVIPMDQAYGGDLSVLGTDFVHPNQQGLLELAQTAAKALTASAPSPASPPAP